MRIDMREHIKFIDLVPWYSAKHVMTCLVSGFVLGLMVGSVITYLIIQLL